MNTVSNARSATCFDKVKTFFVEKWSKVEAVKGPLESVEKEWFSQRLTRFYRGAAEGYVMNNNGLESTNKVFKDRGTIHERMPILEFLPAVQKWVGFKSARRDSLNVNYVSMALDRPDILLKDMTEGYNLIKTKINFINVQDYHIGVTDNRIDGEVFNYELAKQLFEHYKNDDYNSMDQYTAFQQHVHIIDPNRKCNCYEFGREFKCKHSLCVQILVDKIPVDPSAKTILLGQRRKPGRPKKAAGRYVIQEYNMRRADEQHPGDHMDGDDHDDEDDGNFNFHEENRHDMVLHADNKPVEPARKKMRVQEDEEAEVDEAGQARSKPSPMNNIDVIDENVIDESEDTGYDSRDDDEFYGEFNEEYDFNE